jgi:glycosyltransferase involved in cell wall biosynthesis
MYNPTPLVSCIMPTANRPEFVPIAIRRFLAQDYPRKELVIVDDGRQSVEEFVPDHPDIYYFRHPGGITLGEKRNFAVRNARGNYILHWDDDDWTSSRWISASMTHLLETEADITGLEEVFFLDPVHKNAWHYLYPPDEPQWVHGATLCYRRSHWEDNPFPPVDVGEDCRFLWSDVPKLIVPHFGIDLFVATIHGSNASPKYVKQKWWREENASVLIEKMGKGFLEIREAVSGRMKG